jgi:hypothetical protein
MLLALLQSKSGKKKKKTLYASYNTSFVFPFFLFSFLSLYDENNKSSLYLNLNFQNDFFISFDVTIRIQWTFRTGSNKQINFVYLL